jgi:hypothetical protein
MMRSFKVCFPFFVFFIALTFFVKDNAFFWDTLLQASKHAHFFYENNFSALILPLELDAGHPPFFGVYLAFVWKIFGKSLVVSHFAMLPWLFGIVWQLYRFIRFYFFEKVIFLVLLVTLSNVTLLGQSSLVSPDVTLVFFFLFAANGIFYQKKWQIVIGTIGMSLLSIRGIVLIASLFVYQIYLLFLEKKPFNARELKSVFMSFIPVFLIAGAYYTFHFLETGWWVSTPNEGWITHRETISLSGFFKKIVVLTWRLLDYGLIAVWVLFADLIVKFLKKGERIKLKVKQLFGLPLIVLILFLPLFLFFNNPIAHRYLMPFMLTFTVAVSYVIFNEIENRKWRNLAVVFVLLIQISGNFWVYPKHIAQGWDSTLAHLPYYRLRSEMISYLDENDIPINAVGTEFPMIGSMEYLDLNTRKEGFHEKEIEKDLYILYSNVFNDFSDEELEKLVSDYIVQKEMSGGQVCMILYKKKN